MHQALEQGLWFEPELGRCPNDSFKTLCCFGMHFTQVDMPTPIPRIPIQKPHPLTLAPPVTTDV